jgi:hypothetical protein
MTPVALSFSTTRIKPGDIRLDLVRRSKSQSPSVGMQAHFSHEEKEVQKE